MPRLNDTMETGVVAGLQKFTFSGTRTDHLGSTEYTLVTIAIDVTGSIYYFATELQAMLANAINACKKSPRRNNILVRVITFSSSLVNGYEELHGFKPLQDIDVASYPDFRPSGGTPLFDAVFSAVGATNAYAKLLTDDDYGVNGITIIVTDGSDNMSTTTPAMIRSEIEKAVTGEHIESLVTLLVGINATSYQTELEYFKMEAGIDKYIDAGDATPGKLAKLAEFVSQSVSSQSQALGTGGPSQQISATI